MMLGWIRNTTFETRVAVWYDDDGGEFHQVYLWASERPGNRVVVRNPAAAISPPIRQPPRVGHSRKGRLAVS
jgi:hypothetical protein